jgi:hypothetical protein
MPGGRDDYDYRGAERLPPARKSSGLLWTMLFLLGGSSLCGCCFCGGVFAFFKFRADPNAALARERAKQIDGLIACWSFDEIDTSKVKDQSGRGHDLIIKGGQVGEGAFGKGLVLDGTARQYCELPAADAFNFKAGAGFTFTGWFKSSEVSGTLLSLRSDTSFNQIDLLLRDGKLIVVIGDDTDLGDKNAFAWSRGAVNDNRWHHFAFVRRNSAVELYLDGTLQQTGTGLACGGAITTNKRALGAELMWMRDKVTTYGSPSFKGSLDEICVFDRALPAFEISNLSRK